MSPGLPFDLSDGNVFLIIWIPLILLWVFTLVDLFRNREVTGLAKGLWAVFIIWFPIIGALVYFGVRGKYPDEAAAQERYEAYETQGVRIRERDYERPR
ncbi:MAG: PLD nuclease N-terminal domain-containing protein [Acidimicrobiia bacterium]